MTPSHILLVAPTSDIADTAVRCLLDEAQKVKVVKDFDSAKRELECEPAALVVTELKLGAYNGLHLALRASDTQTPVIVLGTEDPVLESVAREIGVDYLRAPVAFDRLQSLAHALMTTHVGRPIEPVPDEIVPTEPPSWWPAAAETGQESAYFRHSIA